VTAQDRFEAVRSSQIDLLCEATSITLARRELVDFSIPTFVDGAGVAFRGKEITRFEDFAGRKVGVLNGTTTYDVLRSSLSQLGIKTEIVVADDHRSGLGMLVDGKIDAYFADRAILAYHQGRFERGRGFSVGKQYFSYETYGLALERGDGEFRLLVDRTLARLARDGRLATLASKSLGVPNDELLRTLIAINSLPD
jgi:polar amino acid transport system substrate-binding protein